MTKKFSDQQITQYNSKHRKNRDIDIFTGICIGILCDGHVNETELQHLADWIAKHPHIANEYPVSKISSRIYAWLEDGKIDEDEEIELLNILISITEAEKEQSPENKNKSADKILTDIFCTPEPSIFLRGARYCFTGEFEADRDHLESIITGLGATIAKKEVSSTTDFLIVGSGISDNWKHKTGGTKIVKAMEIKARGGKIKILRESHLINELKKYTDTFDSNK